VIPSLYRLLARQCKLEGQHNACVSVTAPVELRVDDAMEHPDGQMPGEKYCDASAQPAGRQVVADEVCAGPRET
jgi:hypothetical protein